MTPRALNQRQLTLRRRARRWLRRLPAPVWAMAMIYGVGGSMCLFAAAFPVSKTAPVTLATVLGILLVIGAAALLRFGTELSPRGLQAVAVAGTICNSILVANCTTPYGAALNSFAYLWIGIYAGQFFEQRAARFQAAVVVLASGVSLWLCALPGTLTAWILVAGSSVLATEALARLNTRLRTQLVTDPLTGLLNRAGFVGASERVRAIADRGGLPVSIALIDLDDFKRVNDLQGHAAGDEFALTIAGAGLIGASDLMNRLRLASSAAWSAGVVEWRRGESLDRAMARADEDLYRAKRDARELREAERVAECGPVVQRSSSASVWR